MGVPGPFTMMRRNWKRSLFIMTTANTALWFTYDYTVTRSVMKACCVKAAEYGDEKLRSSADKTRHITVILNPVACKRKSKKLYTKWVEPLFHLAGIKVSLIETQSPNQACELMKIMSNCDGVVIVGGDGTVNEAINGLLSRPDRSRAVKEFPIGIIPAGQNNSIARYIHQHYITYRNQKEFMIHCASRVVDGVTQKFDALKVTPLDEEVRKTEQPYYAVRDVRYGKYQDSFVKLSGYLFYQTNIKPYWLRLKSLFSNKFIAPQIESISYTETCKGCSRCFEKHQVGDLQPQTTAANEDKSANRRWWGMLAPVSNQKSGPSDEERQEMELAKVDNPECDRWMRVESANEVTEFRAAMMGGKKVRLSLGRDGEYTPSEVIEAQDVRLKVMPELDDAKRLASQEPKQPLAESKSDSAEGSEIADKVKEKEAEDSKTVKFLVDGQPKQAHSIEITSLSKAINVFTGTYFADLMLKINK